MGSSLSRSKRKLFHVKDAEPGYPPPQPPALRRRQAEALYDFHAIDATAGKVRLRPRHTYKQLVRDITLGLDSEIQRMRALLAWLGSQDLRHRLPAKTDKASPHTPHGFLSLVQQGQCSLTSFFVLLCRSAHLAAVILRGCGKGGHYEVGDRDLDRCRHTWTAVFADGTWWLVHPEWALIPQVRVVNPQWRAIDLHEDVTEDLLVGGHVTPGLAIHDDFYFMADPEQFVSLCLPDQELRQWQLLQQPWSWRKFATAARLTSHYFSCGHTLVTPHTCTYHADQTGLAVVKFCHERHEYPSLAHALLLDKPVSRGKEPSPSAGTAYVLTEHERSATTLYVRCPANGSYKLCLFGSTTEDLPLICDFSIQCQGLRFRNYPFPIKPYIGFGPGAASLEAGIWGLGCSGGVINAKVGQDVVIHLGTNHSEKLQVAVHHTHLSSDSLSQYLAVQREEGGVSIVFTMPGVHRNAEYALECFIQEGDGETWNVVNFLVSANIQPELYRSNWAMKRFPQEQQAKFPVDEKPPEDETHKFKEHAKRAQEAYDKYFYKERSLHRLAPPSSGYATSEAEDYSELSTHDVRQLLQEGELTDSLLEVEDDDLTSDSESQGNVEDMSSVQSLQTNWMGATVPQTKSHEMKAKDNYPNQTHGSRSFGNGFPSAKTHEPTQEQQRHQQQQQRQQSKGAHFHRNFPGQAPDSLHMRRAVVGKRLPCHCSLCGHAGSGEAGRLRHGGARYPHSTHTSSEHLDGAGWPRDQSPASQDGIPRPKKVGTIARIAPKSPPEGSGRRSGVGCAVPDPGVPHPSKASVFPLPDRKSAFLGCAEYMQPHSRHVVPRYGTTHASLGYPCCCQGQGVCSVCCGPGRGPLAASPSPDIMAACPCSGCVPKDEVYRGHLSSDSFLSPLPDRSQCDCCSTQSSCQWLDCGNSPSSRNLAANQPSALGLNLAGQRSLIYRADQIYVVERQGQVAVASACDQNLILKGSNSHRQLALEKRETARHPCQGTFDSAAGLSDVPNVCNSNCCQQPAWQGKDPGHQNTCVSASSQGMPPGPDEKQQGSGKNSTNISPNLPQDLSKSGSGDHQSGTGKSSTHSNSSGGGKSSNTTEHPEEPGRGRNGSQASGHSGAAGNDEDKRIADFLSEVSGTSGSRDSGQAEDVGQGLGASSDDSLDNVHSSAGSPEVRNDSRLSETSAESAGILDKPVLVSRRRPQVEEDKGDSQGEDQDPQGSPRESKPKGPPTFREFWLEKFGDSSTSNPQSSSSGSDAASPQSSSETVLAVAHLHRDTEQLERQVARYQGKHGLTGASLHVPKTLQLAQARLVKLYLAELHECLNGGDAAGLEKVLHAMGKSVLAARMTGTAMVVRARNALREWNAHQALRAHLAKLTGATVSEIAFYYKVSAEVINTMRATFTLLGEQLTPAEMTKQKPQDWCHETTPEWLEVRRLMHGTGKRGLLYRMSQFQFETVAPQAVRQAAAILASVQPAHVESCSSGAVIFYRWCRDVIRECRRRTNQKPRTKTETRTSE